MSTLLGTVVSSKKNNFDFLRFLAALLVIFSHSYPLTSVSSEPVELFSNQRFTFGSIAVAIFFILSGFLITRSYAKSQSVILYFRARALRIYPALITLVLVTVFLIGPLLTNGNLTEYFSTKKSYLYLINLTAFSHFSWSLFEGNPLPQVNGCLWTLPHEMLCYCMVAIVGSCVQKKFKQFLILAALTAIIFKNYLFFNLNFYYHLYYFTCGALIYLLRNQIKLKTSLAVASLVLLVLNLHFNTNKSLAVLVDGFTLSYFLFYMAYSKTKHLSSFNKYGDFSYGLYLWGFLIQQLLIHYFKVLDTFTNFIFSSICALIIAYLSWHLIEKRAMKFKKAKPVIASNVDFGHDVKVPKPMEVADF